ncbi:MAG: PASTA domain-containing protein [Bacteroidia bacterium]
MKKLIKHIVLIGLLSLFFILAALWTLKFYTKHNEPLILLPNLEGEYSQDAIDRLEELGLNSEIVDTVFKDGAKKLAVINQNPNAGLNVKKGRRVYLVINSDKVPMVEIPDLAGKTSLVQAKNILSRRGLKLGKVIERPCDFVRSRADEPVIAQFAHGDSADLSPGRFIERNSIIDLVICVPMNVSDSLSITSGEPGDDIIELQ